MLNILKSVNQLPKATIMKQLANHGHVMIRGTSVRSPADLSAWVPLIFNKTIDYEEGLSDREMHSDGVVSIGNHTNAQEVSQHTEMAYLDDFPTKIAFGCIVPGGPFEIGNWIRMAEEVPRDIQSKAENLGVKYIRNLSNAEISHEARHEKHWQNVLRSNTKQEAEVESQKQGYDFKWMAKDSIQLSYNKSCYIRHPINGRLSWFNQLVAMHGMFFDLDDRFNDLPYDERPFHATWGDGTEVSSEERQTIEAFYKKTNIEIDWEVGDILVLDNLWYGHGRDAFEGYREVSVMIGDSINRDSLPLV